MAHILYIWELGDHYGHLSTFVETAKALLKKGHKVTLALQNLASADLFYSDMDVTLLQAPVWQVKRDPKKKLPAALTYADLIRDYAYMEPDKLATMIQAWRNLYEFVKPDIMLFNSPPTALLAARDLNDVTKITFGHGYNVPPLTTPLPGIRYWQKFPEAELLKREKERLALINKALEKTGIRPLAALKDMFDVDRQLMTTYRELDHYPMRDPKTVEYLGPPFADNEGIHARWPAGEGKKLFAYIRSNSAHFERMMQAIRATKCRAIVYIPNLTQEMAKKYAAPHIALAMKPLKMAEVKKSVDVIACHAGHGTLASALLGGIPVVALPNHTEQMMLSRRALALGAAVMPKSNATAKQYAAMLHDILHSPKHKAAALAFRKKYQDFDLTRWADTCADRILDAHKARTAPKGKRNLPLKKRAKRK